MVYHFFPDGKISDQRRSRISRITHNFIMMAADFSSRNGTYVIAHEKKIKWWQWSGMDYHFWICNIGFLFFFALLLILIILFLVNTALGYGQVLSSFIFSLTSSCSDTCICIYQQQPVKQAGIFAQKITQPNCDVAS